MIKLHKDKDAWFHTFLENKDRYLENWLNELPKEVSVKLDFSVESLLFFQEYLQSNYSHIVNDTDERCDWPLSAEEEETRLAWVNYYGEVYLRHFEYKNGEWALTDFLDWDIWYYKKRRYIIPFEVRFIDVCGNNYDVQCYRYPIDKHPIKNFQEIFYSQNNYEKELNRNNNPIDFGNGGTAYSNFIMLGEKKYTPALLKTQLEKKYNNDIHKIEYVWVHENYLGLKINDYCFHFLFVESEDVKSESEEIAASYQGADKKQLATCNRRIEFWGDDDSEGEYFNEHLYILERLENNKNCFIFNPNTGAFL